MRIRDSRPGYTLVEIMCVVAIIIIVAALTIPAMQAMLSDSRLTAAGDAVRSRLADARANAMFEGRAWRFGFIANTGVDQMAPDESSEWDSPNQDLTETPDVVRDQLPTGIVLSLNQGDIMGSEQAGSPGSAWETIAVYNPDGTALDDVVAYFGRPGFGPDRVRVRAVTGNVGIENFNIKVDGQ